jgi:hypothetical protein
MKTKPMVELVAEAVEKSLTEMIESIRGLKEKSNSRNKVEIKNRLHHFIDHWVCIRVRSYSNPVDKKFFFAVYRTRLVSYKR